VAQPPEVTIHVGIEGLPDLAQYFGLWAVEPTRFLAAFEQLRSMDLASHIREAKASERRVRTRADQEGTIALVELQGTLMKTVSSLEEGASSVELRRQVRAAVKDPSIEGILLRIDSPGGTVAGTADLAKEVSAAAKKKPVYAFVEDLGASAAYWVASQATKVYANDPTALVGSIGTFVGLYDLSKQAEMLGIRPIVVSSGGMKGVGFPGSEISEEMVAELQGLVDKTQEEFSRAIARGRGLPIGEVRKLADGRVHMASDAEGLKLIDGIKTLDQVLSALGEAAEQGKRSLKSEGVPMPDKDSVQTTSQAASYDEIVAACKGASSDFVCDQLKAKATIEQARSAWTEELVRRNDAQTQRIAALEKDKDEAVRAAKVVKPGVAPLGVATAKAIEDAGDPIAEWHEKLEAKVKRGLTRARASSQLAREEPELRQAFVEAWNDIERPAGRK
jgi:signal peptide peptidase SppA